MALNHKIIVESYEIFEWHFRLVISFLLPVRIP